MEKHFVEFYSPGTFTAEKTVKPIDSWDIEKATELSRGITERYDAIPYGFRFFTRTRTDVDLDSSISAKSPMYYLGGRVETLEQIEARNDPKEEILRCNMRSNGYSRVIINTNSWKWTQPLNDEDVVLDFDAEGRSA